MFIVMSKLCFVAGKELTEDEIQALTEMLPNNHAEVVKRRVDTLNATLRKKQKYTTKIDVRNIFPQQKTAESGAHNSVDLRDVRFTSLCDNLNYSKTPLLELPLGLRKNGLYSGAVLLLR